MTESRFQQLREKLDAFGFHPSKKLGQNFLVDGNFLSAIVDAAELDRTELVFEIGPGPGTLTHELLAKSAGVVAAEIDARLVAFLRDESASWGLASPLEIVHGDVLERGELAPGCLDALHKIGAAPLRYACISNLPYSVSGPVLAALACSSLPPARILALCQYELVERVLAGHGSKTYGSLSALLALGFRGKMLRRVPGDVFRPRPAVESALLRLEARAEWFEKAAAQRRAFARFLQMVFAGRRKRLRNVLRRLLPDLDVDAASQRAGLDPLWLLARPEALAPLELLAVHEAFAEELAS